jgi:hypothetical protein
VALGPFPFTLYVPPEEEEEPPHLLFYFFPRIACLYADDRIDLDG